jgi:hypothetical protein
MNKHSYKLITDLMKKRSLMLVIEDIMSQADPQVAALLVHRQSSPEGQALLSVMAEAHHGLDWQMYEDEAELHLGVERH